MFSLFQPCKSKESDPKIIKPTIKPRLIYPVSDDKIIVIGEYSKKLQVWDTKTRTQIGEASFENTIDRITPLADGTIIVSFHYYDAKAIHFDPMSSKCLNTLPKNTVSYNTSALDGQHFITPQGVTKPFLIYDCKTAQLKELSFAECKTYPYYGPIKQLSNGRIACLGYQHLESDVCEILLFEKQSQDSESKEHIQESYKVVDSIKPTHTPITITRTNERYTDFINLPDNRIVSHASGHFQLWDGSRCVDEWDLRGDIHKNAFRLQDIKALEDNKTLLLYFWSYNGVGKYGYHIALFNIDTHNYLYLDIGNDTNMPQAVALSKTGMLIYSTFENDDIHLLDCNKAAELLAEAKKSRSFAC